MIKKIKFFLFLLFLYSCGYSPIYEMNQKQNFGLDKISYSGEKKIGREIALNLEKFKNKETQNIFDAVMVISKRLEIVSKDKKGDPSSFKLIIDLKLNLESKTSSNNFEKKFIKVKTFDSMDNKFELNQYMNNLEKNMIFNILQDINIFLNIIENDL